MIKKTSKINLQDWVQKRTNFPYNNARESKREIYFKPLKCSLKRHQKSVYMVYPICDCSRSNQMTLKGSNMRDCSQRAHLFLSYHLIYLQWQYLNLKCQNLYYYALSFNLEINAKTINFSDIHTSRSTHRIHYNTVLSESEVSVYVINCTTFDSFSIISLFCISCFRNWRKYWICKYLIL